MQQYRSQRNFLMYQNALDQIRVYLQSFFSNRAKRLTAALVALYNPIPEKVVPILYGLTNT